MPRPTIADKVREMGWSLTSTGGGFWSFSQEFGDILAWINDGEGSLPNGIINEPVTLHLFKIDQTDSEPFVSIVFRSFLAANTAAQNILIK